MDAAKLETIKQTMTDYFINTAGIPEEAVKDGNVTVESLGIDSLSMVELLWVLEEKFNLHIEDVTSLKGITIDGLVEHFHKLLLNNPAPQHIS